MMMYSQEWNFVHKHDVHGEDHLSMKLENGMRDSRGRGLDAFDRMPDSFPLEATQVRPEDAICGLDVLLLHGTILQMGHGNVTHMTACRMHDDVLKALYGKCSDQLGTIQL